MSNITHKVFLDDSGNKEYDPNRDYSTNGRTPYFVFGGMIVRPEVAGQIDAAMDSLKLNAFRNSNVEIKANWLKRPDQRRKFYLEPYAIDDARLNEFVNSVYALINAHDCQLIACVVNKAEVQTQYTNRTWYAPAIAYECVLQRVQQAMEECNGYGHVTIDDMDGKSPKGSDWKENLQKHHRQLRSSGSKLLGGMAIDRVLGDSPTFKDSATDHRLQLSDLVSYAVYRQFVEYGPDWEKQDAKVGDVLPTYDYFERIGKKFRNRNGRVQGFGVVKFPMKNRIEWNAEK